MSRLTPTRPIVLGIDFGTSNTAAAYIDASATLQVIQLDGAKAEMPTALFFDTENHQTLYGSQAMQAYLAGTEGRLLRSLKSLLGSALMNEYTAVGERSLRYFDIVVLFFKELKRRCEAQVGQPIDHVVLGRPVHFVDDNPERDALAQDTLGQAAQEAGFGHIRYQLEPIAAALDYGQRISTDTTVLVVDIGGGTSDFTVMRLHAAGGQSSPPADVLATTGVHIGGTDFDRLLDLATVMPHLGYKHVGTGGRIVPSSVFFDLSTWHLIHQAYTRKAMHFAKELWTDYADQRLHRRLMTALECQYGHRMLASVEAAKIACSISGQPTAVDLAYLDADLPATTIDAPGMEEALHASLQQVVQCAVSCIDAAGLSAVDVVYLTGGSSALRTLIAALAQAMPQATLVEGNRFGGVAAGLAWQGMLTPA